MLRPLGLRPGPQDRHLHPRHRRGRPLPQPQPALGDALGAQHRHLQQALLGLLQNVGVFFILLLLGRLLGRVALLPLPVAAAGGGGLGFAGHLRERGAWDGVQQRDDLRALLDDALQHALLQGEQPQRGDVPAEAQSDFAADGVRGLAARQGKALRGLRQRGAQGDGDATQEAAVVHHRPQAGLALLVQLLDPLGAVMLAHASREVPQLQLQVVVERQHLPEGALVVPLRVHRLKED
mmetsp:Transcript_37191/g.94001  ORF Transcript_37191/g.94001 Transcript_37191/m.94001 type:complete len:237 (-) Transcript_37191:847-1557(-)